MKLLTLAFRYLIINLLPTYDKKNQLIKIKKQLKESDYRFKKFMNNEGYFETIDKTSNFRIGSLLFYKKMTEVFFHF